MTLKSIDLFGQILSALLFSIFNWSAVPALIPSVALIAFVVIQVTSLLVHAGLKNRSWKEKKLRWIHLAGLIIVVAIMLYGLYKPASYKYDFSGLDIMAWALVPAAAVALFYVVITFLEWRKMRRLNKSLVD